MQLATPDFPEFPEFINTGEEVDFPEQPQIKSTLSLKAILESFPSPEPGKNRVRVLVHHYLWPNSISLDSLDLSNPETWNNNAAKETISRISAALILANSLIDKGYEVELINGAGDMTWSDQTIPTLAVQKIITQYQEKFANSRPINLKNIPFAYSTIEEWEAAVYGGVDLAGIVSVTSAYHVPRTEMYFDMVPPELKSELSNTKVMVLGNPIIKVGNEVKNLGLFTQYDLTILPQPIQDLLKNAAIPAEVEMTERKADVIKLWAAKVLSNLLLDLIVTKTRRGEELSLKGVILETLKRKDPEEIIRILQELTTQTTQDTLPSHPLPPADA